MPSFTLRIYFLCEGWGSVPSVVGVVHVGVVHVYKDNWLV